MSNRLLKSTRLYNSAKHTLWPSLHPLRNMVCTVQSDYLIRLHYQMPITLDNCLGLIVLRKCDCACHQLLNAITVKRHLRRDVTNLWLKFIKHVIYIVKLSINTVNITKILNIYLSEVAHGITSSLVLLIAFEPTELSHRPIVLTDTNNYRVCSESS